MLTLKMLRDNPERVIKKLAVKNFDAASLVEDILLLDDKRKALQQGSDALLAEQKRAAAAIGRLIKEGKKEEAEAAKEEVAALKARSNELLAQVDQNNEQLQAKLVNKEGLKLERVELFRELLVLMEKYRRLNQWA